MRLRMGRRPRAAGSSSIRTGRWLRPRLKRKYDAFISYSHGADGLMSVKVQRGLERFAKPWYRRRALKVFRDATGLAVTEHLWPTIKAALRGSSHFILLASPEAAESKWVAREITDRLDVGGNVWIVLTSGSIVWDEEAGDFDWEATDAVPPVLRGYFADEPLFLDLTWADSATDLSLDHPKFRDAVATLAAPIHGVEKAELSSEAVVEHRRTVRTAWAAVATLAILLVLSAIFGRMAATARDEAETQRDLAVSNNLAAQASRDDHRLDTRLLYAVEAMEIHDDVSTYGALLGTLQEASRVVAFLHATPHDMIRVAFSPDGRTLAGLNARGQLFLWSVDTGSLLASSEPRQESADPFALATLGVRASGLRFDDSGETIYFSSRDTFMRWDARTLQRMRDAKLERDLTAFEPTGSIGAHWGSGASGSIVETFGAAAVREFRFDPPPEPELAPIGGLSPDGRSLAVVHEDGVGSVWATDSGRQLATGLSLDGGIGYLRFDPEGRRLLAANASMQLFDTDTWKPKGPRMERHQGLVVAVAFSPGGDVLASASEDGTVGLWDLETGQPIGDLLDVHVPDVIDVQFSPDGQLIAAANSDGSVVLLKAGNAPSNALSEALPRRGGRISDLAYHPEGRILATPGCCSDIVLWDVDSGRPRGPRLLGHEAGVSSLAFHSSGRLLASGSYDRTIRLWDTVSGRAIGGPIVGHQGFVRRLAFSPDGNVLASAADDHTVRIWDPVEGRPLGLPLSAHSAGVWALAFDPEGTVLASGGGDGLIRRWHPETGKMLGQPLEGHPSGVSGLAFSPDGTLFASADPDGRLLFWDAKTYEPIGEPIEAHSDWINDLEFAPDGAVLASAGDDRTLRLWDSATRQALGSLSGHEDEVWALAFSPDGRSIASGGVAARGILWDVRTQRRRRDLLNGPVGSSWPIAFSADSRFLASVRRDVGVVLRDAETGKPFGRPLSYRGEQIESAAFSPDGRLLALGADEAVTLWDVQSQRLVGEPLRGHEYQVLALAFGPEGRTLVSGGLDKRVRLWDVESGRALVEFPDRHEGPVFGVAISPDGSTVASAGTDGRLLVWDAASGKMRNQLPTAPNVPIWEVVFSPDGRLLAAGDESGTLALFETERFTPLGPPRSVLDVAIQWMAFSPAGRELAYAGSDGAIRLLDLATRAPREGVRITGYRGAFSADGRSIVSASGRAIRVWERSTSQRLEEWWTSAGIQAAAVSPDGRTLALGTGDGAILRWDLEGRHLLPPIIAHADLIKDLAFSPDGEILASASRDHTVGFWDVETGEPVGDAIDHGHPVTAVALSVKNGWVATAGKDDRARLWALDSRDAIGAFEGRRPIPQEATELKVAFSPDGATLALVGGVEAQLFFFDVETRERLGDPVNAPNIITSLAFSADGNVLATGLGDETVIVWDVASRNPVAGPLVGHLHDVTHVAVSPEGSLVASASLDRTVLLWDIDAGQALGPPLVGHEKRITGLEFGPDGRRLISTDTERALVWDLDAEFLSESACRIANRDLECEEWCRYIQAHPYRSTCSGRAESRATCRCDG